MFRRLIALWRLDLTSAFRDSILVYVLIAPLILAVLARIFLPGFEDIQLTFVITEDLPDQFCERLEHYGNVETVSNVNELEARIAGSDEVAGILRRGDRWVIRLEGDEHPEFRGAISAVFSQVVEPSERTQITTRSLGGSRTQLLEYAAVILVMLTTLMGAMVAGLRIVDEKDTQTIRALAVSPLPIRDYVLARGIFSVFVGAFICFLVSLIVIGTNVDYGLVAIGLLCSAGPIILAAFIVGALASNQVQAMGVIKILMTVYLSIPVIAIFIPEQFHVFMWWLPNYWMFSIFVNAYVGQAPVGYWPSVGLTVVTSVVFIAALVPMLRRRLRLR